MINEHQVSASYLMAQTGVQYTYFHEQGHLIQFSNLFHGWTPIDGVASVNLKEGPVNELVLISEESINRHKKFEPNKHVTEYDADIHGVSVTVNHLNNFFINSLQKKYQSQEIFEKLLVIHLVGIFCYIMILWGSWNEPIYYKQSSHPHSAIRVLYIMLAAVSIAQNYFPKIENRSIMEEVFRVLNVYCEAKGRPTYITEFYQLLKQEEGNIMNHLKFILNGVDSKDFEFLVVNTEHKY